MSKLSHSLKALINAPASRPGPCAAPSHIRDVYSAIARDAVEKKLGPRPWIALTTAATFTLNSPDSLPILHDVAASHQQQHQQGDSSAAAVSTAELIREVGLKCISFNGIPRTINCLNAFHDALPQRITSQLATQPSRLSTPSKLEARQARGNGLWTSVYAPYDTKLYDKLARSHPDLPVHILQSHYAHLLSDPEVEAYGSGTSPAGVGRILTSLVAITCLRAQTGVGPQVLSHVYGLRKALQDGTWEKDRVAEAKSDVEWLAGDEGSEWVLRTVDGVVEALGGSNFAQKAKL